MSTRLVLGVDGGNTKTIAVIADESGKVHALAKGGTTDMHSRIGPEGALLEIVRIVREALTQAGIAASDLSASVFSLAGADWPEDFELLTRELTARLSLPAPPLVVNDALGALRCGAPTWEGVSIACGTFNAIGARHRDGRVFHIGFWPDPVGRRARGVQRFGLARADACVLAP
jgi:N-acetylglucosamine kinase-like BadF-type ATPase